MLFFAGSLFDNVLVVVASVAVKFGLGDFDNGADQLVQEFSVVGDHENRPWIIS